MKVWIDVENLPQVLFFSPALRALRARGHSIFITAIRKRYLAEVCDQKQWHVDRTVGAHSERGRAFKIAGGLLRAAGLVRATRPFRPDVLVNFASRPAILASSAQRVPIFTIFDYEHVALPLVGKLSRIICLPSAVSAGSLESLGIPEEKVLWFPATKEDLYASDFQPSSIRENLGVPGDRPFALLRPPASTAHYHDARSETIYEAILERIDRAPQVHARVLCRTQEDRRRLESRFPGHTRIRHLESTGDGLNLIWNSDLVLSGGGTMSREAAALGVPSYSFFMGRIGAVDQSLFDQGRVGRIDSVDHLDRIRFDPRPRTSSLPPERSDLIELLVRGIEGSADLSS